MTLKSKFLQEDTLRNRKRLGPLGWIVVFIVVVFLAACVLGMFLLVTHNVSPLIPDQRNSTTQIAAGVTINEKIRSTPTT